MQRLPQRLLRAGRRHVHPHAADRRREVVRLRRLGHLALVAHLATFKTRIPFMHFFDGYRTSAQINKINTIPYDEIAKLVPERIYSLEMHPSASKLLAAAGDTWGRVGLWDVGGGTLESHHKNMVRELGADRYATIE